MTAVPDVGDRARPSLLGAGALLLSTSALVPLFVDLGWLPAVFAVTVAVVLTGVGLRAAGAPMPAVVLVQSLVVAIVATVLFTRSGTLGFLPGPGAITDLRALLDGAGQQVRDERVPVAVSTQLGLLVVLTIGTAAVVVDLLVAGLAAPAGAGLVLLTTVAVPASLLDGPLPWWTFVLGALALILLLIADGDLRTVRAGPAAGTAGLRSPVLVAVVAASILVGLFSGVGGLGVGTEGRLTGSGGGGGVGLNPFTQLRGQLDQPETTPLFSVQGMTTPTYLRSLSLDTYVANRGWVLDDVVADEPLTGPLDDDGLRGEAVDIRVVPDQYTDRWLPTPGTPVDVRAAASTERAYSYDRALGTLFTDDTRPLPRYRVRGVVPSAAADQLRAASTPGALEAGAVDPRFYSTSEIDPEITRITAELVPAGTDDLDAAVILADYFRDPANGFVYDVETAGEDPGSDGDALVAFLTTGRRGFCEQYASAMATMLRTLGLPTRVGVGFTAGTGGEDTRLITTDDAHAWVEVYFTDIGWVQFDPTPLSDGRGVVPDYVTQAQQQRDVGAPEAAAPEPSLDEPDPGAAAERPRPDQDPGAEAADAAATTEDASPVLSLRLLLGLGAVVAVVLVLSTPPGVRALRRRRRLADGSADATWDEVLDVVGDHGGCVRASESPRRTAERVVDRFGLADDDAAALHRMVDDVETSWYAADGAGGIAVLPARSTRDLRIFTRALARAEPPTVRHRLVPRSLRRTVGASSLHG